jgi:O-antigen ligase
MALLVRRRRRHPSGAHLFAFILLAPAAIAAVAGLSIALAAWPATVLLTAVVLGILLLAWRRPELGLGAAVLLYGFEGSVKILLGLEATPLPGGNRAAGAAALDVALFGSIAAVIARDRLRTPNRVWTSATRAERVAIGLILAWLALSIVQVGYGLHISRGLHGFRLFQLYTLVAVATLTVFSNPRLRPAALRGALLIGLVVSLYAAVRVVFGPSDAETAFATSVPTVTTYGGVVRAIGSFSSAIGLSSFLTPFAVFALVIGLLMPRLRLLAWGSVALAVIGLVGSYSRASLFGVGLGLVVGLVIVFAVGEMSSRRRLTAAGLVLALLAGSFAAVVVASHASPALERRAKGILDPLHDESVRLRFRTWRRTLDEVGRHPFGQGVGSVGAASSATRLGVKTTDNSYLKVLIDQGVLGFALFITGFLSAIVLLARRLRRTAGDARAMGCAALAGFVSFLGISAVGESVEQPGKIVAWGLLGIAAAIAFAPALRADDG